MNHLQQAILPADAHRRRSRSATPTRPATSQCSGPSKVPAPEPSVYIHRDDVTTAGTNKPLFLIDRDDSRLLWPARTRIQVFSATALTKLGEVLFSNDTKDSDIRILVHGRQVQVQIMHHAVSGFWTAAASGGTIPQYWSCTEDGSIIMRELMQGSEGHALAELTNDHALFFYERPGRQRLNQQSTDEVLMTAIALTEITRKRAHSSVGKSPATGDRLQLLGEGNIGIGLTGAGLCHALASLLN